MNAYHNSWPEEQQHLARQQELIRDAERRRLVRLVQKHEVQPARASGLNWAWLGRLRCRLSALVEHIPARLRPAAQGVLPTDCP